MLCYYQMPILGNIYILISSTVGSCGQFFRENLPMQRRLRILKRRTSCTVNVQVGRKLQIYGQLVHLPIGRVSVSICTPNVGL